ncbi:hypothetical protein LINPERHAP1_LOCUS26261 [Linum perenne]
MHYISQLKYLFEGFLINEFTDSGKSIGMVLGACAVAGEEVLKEEGCDREEGRRRNIVIMAGLLFYRFMGYLIFRVRCSSTSAVVGSTRRWRGIGSGGFPSWVFAISHCLTFYPVYDSSSSFSVSQVWYKSTS